MGQVTAKSYAETWKLVSQFDEKLRRWTELTGELPVSFHKSLLLQILDPTTRAHLTQHQATDDDETFGVRVTRFVMRNAETSQAGGIKTIVRRYCAGNVKGMTE